MTTGSSRGSIAILGTGLAGMGHAGGATEQEIIAQGLNVGNTLKAHVTPFLTYDRLNYFALILCLMVGTASLPHILMRYFTTPSVRDARKSVAWSLL